MNRISKLVLTISLIVTFTSGLLSAQNITLQEKKDAYICDCAPAATNPGGDGTRLYQGPYFEGGHRCFARTLLKWDFSTVPVGAEITSAKMELKCTGIFGSLTGKMVFYRLTETWEQTNVNHNNCPKYASQDSVTSHWPSKGQWISIDITEMVKYWLAHPESNFGILGHSALTTTNTGAVEYGGSKYSNSADRPKLTIEYTTTDVKSEGSLIPSGFNLKTFPNPFNPTINISYSIDKTSLISLKIYNANGKQIDQINREYKQAGEHHSKWNANGFGSGIYFVVLDNGINRAVKKVVFLK